MLRAYRADPTTRALVLHKRGRKPGSKRLDPRIEQIIDRVIQDFYRTRQKPAMAQLVSAIAQECRRVDLKPPTWRPVAARVAALDPAATLRDREGPKAAADKYRPVRDSYEADHALQIVQIDHTKVDVFVVDEIDRLAIQRPWLTLCIVAGGDKVGHWSAGVLPGRAA